jgi:DNA-binding response OmpR family regulator
MWGTECRLLIVEDNPADVQFLKHALGEDGIAARIDVASDGEKALEYLAKCSEDQRPDLVIIDVNLPRRDGIEVLRKCRFSPVLAQTKTLMLTSSDDPNDHLRADTLGADSYIRKPRVLDDFAAIVETIRTLLQDCVRQDANGSA